MDRRTEHDLAALADGSLPPERRAEVEARVAASPELRAALAEQRRAVVAARSAAPAAPAGLRARVHAHRPAWPPERRRLALGGALAAAAAAAVALAIVLPGDGDGAEPTVVDAARLAARPASAPAPPRDSRRPRLLARRVDGIPFPDWGGRLRWPATGERSDRLDGRRATTVFYTRGRQRIGYTIVAGAPLPPPVGRRRVVDGVEFRSLRSAGQTVVTWRRSGHTCVLAGRGVPARVMIALATYRAGTAARGSAAARAPQRY